MIVFKNDTYLSTYYNQYLCCYGMTMLKMDIRLYVRIRDIMSRSLRRNIFISREDYLFSDV